MIHVGENFFIIQQPIRNQKYLNKCHGDVSGEEGDYYVTGNNVLMVHGELVTCPYCGRTNLLS